jgi:hypothetical protein
MFRQFNWKLLHVSNKIRKQYKKNQSSSKDDDDSDSDDSKMAKTHVAFCDALKKLTIYGIWVTLVT